MSKIILVLIIGGLLVVPQLVMPNAEFSGADDAAGNAITSIDKNYVPWFQNIFDPGEMEGTLFHFQQAMGVGGLAVCFYYLYKKSKKNEKVDKSA
jgi:cobalt/nickel transport protein